MDKTTEETEPFITDALIDSWEEKLRANSNSEFTKLTSNDTNIEDYDLTTHPELRTINNDVDRTRIRERVNFLNFPKILRNLLIYYCKLNDVEYKQGMNEIMAPFILLKEKITPSKMNIPRIVNLFSYFVDNFLTNYFYEKDLFAFKSSVSLLTLLLRYHDPELHNIFESVQISPQMYATNWLLTTNANKHSIDIVYKLWDYLIKENDQLFIHFIVIAFLKQNRDNFKSTESAAIPILFSKCCITSDSELSKIIQQARIIRQHTPNSFRLLVNKLEIFKPRSHKLKIMYEKFNTDEMISLPILASEVLYNEFKNEIYCADSQCKHYIKNNNDNVSSQNEFECYFCKNGQKSLKHELLLIDLRVNAVNEGTLNILSENYFLTQKHLQSDNVGKILYENIEHHKGKKHIILVTSDTEYFDDYEERFFIQQTNNPNKGHIQVSDNSFLNSVLNDKEFKSLQKTDKTHTQLDKLQEYKNIKKIISELLKQNFPYVSYSYNGFKEIHELCVKYNFPLESHNNKKCKFCLIDQDKNATIECYTKIFSKKPQTNTSLNVNNQLYQNIPVVPRSEGELMKQKMLDEQSKQKTLKEQEVKVDTFIEPIEIITQDKMNTYLTDTSNIIFHCNLLEHNMYIYKEKITIIIFYDCVKFFKMRIRGNQMFFDLLATVKYDLFKKINRDNTIFNLFYTKDNYTHDLKVDLYSDVDADNFYDVFSNDIIVQ